MVFATNTSLAPGAQKCSILGTWKNWKKFTKITWGPKVLKLITRCFTGFDNTFVGITLGSTTKFPKHESKLSRSPNWRGKRPRTILGEKNQRLLKFQIESWIEWLIAVDWGYWHKSGLVINNLSETFRPSFFTKITTVENSCRKSKNYFNNTFLRMWEPCFIYTKCKTNEWNRITRHRKHGRGLYKTLKNAMVCLKLPAKTLKKLIFMQNALFYDLGTTLIFAENCVFSTLINKCVLYHQKVNVGHLKYTPLTFKTVYICRIS